MRYSFDSVDLSGFERRPRKGGHPRNLCECGRAIGERGARECRSCRREATLSRDAERAAKYLVPSELA